MDHKSGLDCMQFIYLYGDNAILTEYAHGITEEGLVHIGFKLKVCMRIKERNGNQAGRSKCLRLTKGILVLPKVMEQMVYAGRILFHFPRRSRELLRESLQR